MPVTAHSTPGAGLTVPDGPRSLPLLTRSAALRLGLAAAAIGAACRAREPATERRLRIALGSAPVSLDPHYTAEAAAYVVQSNIFETLVETDEQLALRPALAVGWSNSDDVTWLFRLDPRARFHDGSPLTSADVVFSLLRARDDPRSEWRADVSSLAAVEAPAPDQVIVRTTRPQPTLLRSLAGIAIVPQRGPGAEGPDPHPIGSGPFRFVSATPDLARVELARFEAYRGPRPAFDRVLIVALPDDEARRRTARAAEADLLVDVPPDSVAELRRDPGWTVLLKPGLREMFLAFDVSRERTPYASPARNPFRDRRVRLAFLKAIDAASIVHETLRGFALEATQFAAPSVFGYEPALERPPRDVEEAHRLLGEAGFGEGFTVSLHATQGVYLGDGPIADTVSRSLAEVGVTVRAERVSKAELFERVKRHDTSFYLLTWSCLSADVQEVFDNLLHSPDPARGLGLDNGGGYSNPRLDELAEQAARTMLPRTRAALLRRAVATAMEDLPWVPLYVQTHVYALRTPYRWRPRPDKKVRAADVQVAP